MKKVSVAMARSTGIICKTRRATKLNMDAGSLPQCPANFYAGIARWSRDR
jgi:hypothetical protein